MKRLFLSALIFTLLAVAFEGCVPSTLPAFILSEAEGFILSEAEGFILSEAEGFILSEAEGRGMTGM